MQPEQVRNRLAVCGIPCDEALAARLVRYHEMLLDWNTRMDLTNVTDEAEMLDRHYVDSLVVLSKPGLLPESGKVIDVGTGAGLPGMVLALACPHLSFTLMDAQQKRLNFLQAVIDDLHLTNVTLLHSRAEDAGRQADYREQFDLAVARAVAPLSVLAEYLLPLVKVGGSALCWKGPALLDEMGEGRRAAFLVGGKVGKPVPCTIPERDWQHMLLEMKKTMHTPKMYPRKAGVPGKKPLGTKLEGGLTCASSK